MPGAVLAGLYAIDQQAAAGPRIEPELLDGAAPVRFFENRPHLPRLTRIVRDQQERVPRRGLHGLTADPAVLEIDELNLFEHGAAYSGVRLRPCPASVVAREQNRRKRRGFRMEIPGQE